MLLHIIKYKFRSYLKSTLDLRTVAITRGIGTLIVYGSFAYGMYSLAYFLTSFMLEHTKVGLHLYHTFISMMLFVFFIAVNLGNIIVSYSTLYRSAEVNFFFTKPVPFVKIFILKFFDNFFYSSTTLFIVAFMALLGYGNYFGHPWYFFVGSMLFVLIPFMFLAACLAVLVLMAIMKVAGKVGFKSVMAGLFILYFFLIFLFFKQSNPVTLVEQLNRYYPQMDKYISQVIPTFLNYLPNQWVSEYLFYCARGEIVKAFPYAGLILLITILIYGLCIFIAKRYYYKSWLVSLQIKSIARVPYNLAKRKFLDFRSKSILSPQLEVLTKKEYFSFIREASQWIHFLIMIILTALFALSISNLNLRLRVMDIQLLTYIVIFSFSGFMVSSLALRFIFPMIGMEGQAFWTLRSSPVKESKILLVKFVLGFSVVLLMAMFISISGNLPFARMTAMRPLLLWFGVFNAFWISLTMVSLNLGFGSFFANYSERNPIRAASTQGATLTFLITIAYLIILVIIILLPISSYFSTLFMFRQFDMKLIIIPGTVFGVISYILTVIGLITGLRSLRRDF